MPYAVAHETYTCLTCCTQNIYINCGGDDNLRCQEKSISVMTAQELVREVKFNEAGLVPAIVQDVYTQQVLMMAWMNAESLQQTLTLGEAVFWSRSRHALWHKGATSGNVQKVVDISVDCDGDTLLLRVEPAGPACHTGAVSCFFRTHNPHDGLVQ